jgi:hypothetical protein
MKRKLLTIFFVAIISLAHAQGQRVTIYNDWKSNQCNYTTERPFTIIKSALEFHNFWEKSGIKDVEPAIDFQRFMVFLWIPGSTLYDVLETQIDEVRYQPEACLVLFNFKRKMSGKWNKPVVATVLPKIENVDFFIYKRVERGHLKAPTWQHYTSIWDMNKQRTKDFMVAEVNPEEKLSDDFIIEKNTQAYKDIFKEINSSPMVASTASTQKKTFASLVKPEPSKQPEPIRQPEPAKPFTPPPPRHQHPIREEAAKSQPAPKVQPATFQQRLPALMEEDPLFGSEFDIQF